MDNNKYYLRFKKVYDNSFTFDNVIVTDGKYICNEGKKGIIDPIYENQNKSFFSSEPPNLNNKLISFDSETFKFIYKGGNPYISLSKSPVNSSTKWIYFEVPGEFYNSLLNKLRQSGKTLDDSKKEIGINLYRIGDSVNSMVTNIDKTGKLTMYFLNEGNYSKVKSRPDEYVCRQLNISYKKTQSMNAVGSSNKPKVSNQNVKKFDVTREQITEIYKSITEKVVAQDETVKTVLYNIFMNQRIINTNNEDLINSSKANIILDGPTGTGKTLMLKLITEQLSLPMVLRPVTAFSTTGYRGADLNELLISLLDATNGDLELAQRGIIVLDEFDKLASNNDRDLKMKLAVQQELLSYISGAKFDLEYGGKNIVFDTSKLTFIGLGAFNDLRERKIAENEKKNSISLGFSSPDMQEYERKYSMTQEDYIDEGLMRELVGRFTTITSTQTLTKEKLKEILKESKLSPLKGLQEIGKSENIKISVDDEVVDEIAQTAYENNFGARGLQTLFNNIKNTILEDLLLGSKNQITIDMELLNKSKGISVRRY